MFDFTSIRWIDSLHCTMHLKRRKSREFLNTTILVFQCLFIFLSKAIFITFFNAIPILYKSVNFKKTLTLSESAFKSKTKGKYVVNL